MTPMRFIDDARRNAAFIGVLFAIVLAGLALVAATIALISRMG
jgi:hypothetical protein